MDKIPTDKSIGIFATDDSGHTIRRTKIADCTTKGEGGGVAHVKDNASLTITNATIFHNTTPKTGGGVSTKAQNVTITGSTIEKNTATGNGGGVYVLPSVKTGALTLDGCAIRENVTSDKGGGVYTEIALTLKGDTMITANRLTTETKANAAGVYQPTNKSLTLTVGEAGAETDGSSVQGNVTASGAPSNLVLSEASGQNTAKSVRVLCNLSGKIYVINAKKKGTKFGVAEGAKYLGFKDSGLTELEHTFIADDNSLFGVFDRMEEDESDGYDIVWRGDVVCKLTDANGRLLYLNEDCTEPAIFDRLDYATNGSRVSPFSYLRAENPALWYDENDDLVPAVYSSLADAFEKINSGASFKYVNKYVSSTKWQDYTAGTGEKVCRIEMLIDRFTPASALTLNSGKQAILTTAAKDAEDGYPYAGSVSSVIARGFNGSSAAFTVNGTLTLTDITLDGAFISGVSANGGIFAVNAGKLVIADGAKLYNARTTGNGGAVSIASDASMEMTGGEITACSAANGGAVYVANGGTVTLENGTVDGTATHPTINGNTATSSGAGIYLVQGAKLKLSGSPNFGGDDLYKTSDTIPEGKAAGDIKGTDGNFTEGTLTDATNGLKAYSRARQDIYVGGYLTADGSAVNAESIVVTGALTGGPGSIWVWCEKPDPYDANNHYEMLTQFAVFDDSLVETTGNGDSTTTTLTLDATNSYLVFRNAQADAYTGCSSDYLTGTMGQTARFINWTGGFDFSFLKIDGTLKDDGTVKKLSGATFALYKQSENAAGTPITETVGGVELPVLTVYTRMVRGTRQAVKATSADGTETYQDDDNNTLSEGTVYFSKLPPSTYYMVETLTPGQLSATQTAAGGISTYADNNVIYKLEISPEGKATLTRTVYLAGRTDGVVDVDGTTGKLTITKDTAASEEEQYWLPNGNDEDGNPIKQYQIMNTVSAKRKVALQKVDNSTPTAIKLLSGAHFRIFRADLTEVTEGQPVDGDGKPLGYYESQASGVYFMGRLPYGTYYLVETQVPAGYTDNAGKVFKLTVGKDTTEGGTTTAGVTVDNEHEVVKLNRTSSEEVIVEAFRHFMTTGENPDA